jgi:hypothetical protein
VHFQRECQSSKAEGEVQVNKEADDAPTNAFTPDTTGLEEVHSKVRKKRRAIQHEHAILSTKYTGKTFEKRIGAELE